MHTFYQALLREKNANLFSYIQNIFSLQLSDELKLQPKIKNIMHFTPLLCLELFMKIMLC